jgi:hypothetical protein
MCIVGNIEELGNWKSFKGRMKWTDVIFSYHLYCIES